MIGSSVADLRQQLISLGMSEEMSKALKGKDNLRNKISLLKKARGQMDKRAVMPEEEESDTDMDSFAYQGGESDDEHCDINLEDLEEGEAEGGYLSAIDSKAIAEQLKEADPVPGDEDWHSFIVSKFRDSELQDGFPTVWGLRRVVEEYVGEIITNQSTVSHLVEIKGISVASAVCNIEIIRDDTKRVARYSDVADCHKCNTPKPYSLHSTSTAATKAESRTLKKILCLRTMTAEEASVGEEEVEYLPENKAVNDTQLRGMDAVCKRLNINALRILTSVAEQTITGVAQIDYALVANTMAKLNDEYASDVTSIPDSILGYEAGWK